MKRNNNPVRGTEDYLPKVMQIREQIKQTILKTYSSFGFMQIGTPVLEDINNLLGSDGGDNLKLIFKVLKRGEKLDLTKPNLTENDIVDIGLKYDQTVPLVRMYSNNTNSLPTPFKSIQIDYSFRADRPQRGRGRQFTQCDIDILGDPSINAEIDIINTTAKTFAALGFSDFVAKVNDRRILADIIASCGFKKEDEAEICICLDKLDKIGTDGVLNELFVRDFDKNSSTKLIKTIEKISTEKNCTKALLKAGVREDVVKNLDEVLSSVNALSTAGFKAVFDVSIVRGQGYYTGLVYEFYMPGFGGACAGGGRYDNMIEKMTGKSIPAVGLGLGFEPTAMLVMERSQQLNTPKTLAVIYKPEDNFVDVLKYISSINKTCNASAILAKKNISFQLETLKNNGFTHFTLFKDKQIKEI